MDHQSQHKEHSQLAKPRQTVEESLGLPLAGEFAITDNQAAYVDCQISISLKIIGNGENKNAGREDHDRIERFVSQLHASHERYNTLTQNEAKNSTHHQLNDNGLNNGQYHHLL